MGRRHMLTIAAIVLAVVVAFAINRRTHGKIPLRIATGQRGGTFLPLGQALASAFVADIPRLTHTVLESPGSNASVEMLERGEVDVALVSSNSRPGERVNLIVPLYMETLQIVVRKASNIATPADLTGKKVSIGPSGSGTETIAWQVMSHFGLARDKAPCPPRARRAPARGARGALSHLQRALLGVARRCVDPQGSVRRGDPPHHAGCIAGPGRG